MNHDTGSQFLKENLCVPKIIQYRAVPILFQGLTRHENLYGCPCGAQQFFVFIVQIQKESADQLRRNGQVQFFQGRLCLPIRELKNDLKMKGGSLPADNGIAIGFQFLPEGAVSPALF